MKVQVVKMTSQARLCPFGSKLMWTMNFKKKKKKKKRKRKERKKDTKQNVSLVWYGNEIVKKKTYLGLPRNNLSSKCAARSVLHTRMQARAHTHTTYTHTHTHARTHASSHTHTHTHTHTHIHTRIHTYAHTHTNTHTHKHTHGVPRTSDKKIRRERKLLSIYATRIRVS